MYGNGFKKTKRKTGRTEQQKLVKKLDSVFSLYIRLRDAMPNGFFRCISCGQIKPFAQADCGHFHRRELMSTRFDERNCNAECRYCMTPDALILTADLRWVKLGEIEVGQKLFGFDEYGKLNVRRNWRTSTVTHVHRDVQEVYDVEMENGDVIRTTAEHKWFCRVRNVYTWIKTEDLWVNGKNIKGQKKTGPHTGHVCTTLCKPFLVVQQDMSNDAGWLAGMLDADGHICQQNIHDPDGTVRYGFRAGIAQSNTYPKICERIVKLMEYFTNSRKPCRQWMDHRRTNLIDGKVVKGKVQTWQFLITGTNVEKLQFLMRLRPMKMEKVVIEKLGQFKSQYDTKVKSIKPAGKQEIVVMETDTHTFIANGYAMHNCNRMKADHLIDYQKHLIEKIGQEEYDKLYILAHSTKHWMVSELKDMIKYYTALTEELRRRKGL